MNFKFLCCLLLSHTAIGAEWGYSGAHGPSHWADDYPLCGGSSQSPIDISKDEEDSEFSAALGDFVLTGYDQTEDRSFSLVNNGHTVKLSIQGDYVLSGGGLNGNYKLAQLHFHWGSVKSQGSEHTLDGHAFPMEIHLVHYSDQYNDVGSALGDPEGLAVLGFFFKLGGKENSGFENIVRYLPSVAFPAPEVPIPTFPITDLLPSMRKYYRYAGSLTTPPCSEAVVWTVFKKRIPISKDQLNAFRALFDAEDNPLVDNYRPVEPLNGRTVYRNFDEC